MRCTLLRVNGIWQLRTQTGVKDDYNNTEPIESFCKEQMNDIIKNLEKCLPHDKCSALAF